MKPPTICAAIIGRNEERDLPRLLKSLAGVADRIVYVDTGSTDDSVKVAAAAGAVTSTYLGASEPDPDRPGEWRLANFAKARNFALEMAESFGDSHILWMDCDDEIKTPLAVRRAAYLPLACYGMWVEIGVGQRLVHYRLIPAAWKLRFNGAVHEWLDMGSRPQAVLNDCCIAHDAAPHPGAGETSNERNLRILTAEYAADPSSRGAYYLGDTHRAAGRWAEAIAAYRARLDFGEGFRDEALFARLYIARCLRAKGELDAAKAELRAAIELAPDWQEFRMELAYIAYYNEKDYATCITEATQAVDKPIPPTVLCREPDKYTDQPARMISWSHEHIGNRAQALVWSQLATRLIGKPDREWAEREARLAQELDGPRAPAITKGLRPRIALHRPGAIGDILMTLNLIPALKEANPGVDVHYYCNAAFAAPDALGSIILQSGCDAVMDCAALPEWRKKYDRVVDLVGYPLAEGYPEKPMRRHLLEYFAQEVGVPWAYGLPALTLRRPKRYHKCPKGDYLTLQVKAGWSKYKQWLPSGYGHLKPDLPWLDALEDALAPIPYDDIPLMFIDAEMGRTLSESIAIFANARMHIGIDSFCNHLTNYFWEDERGNGRRVPGVILWGSTQASAAGYPHNTNISKGLPCQPCFREDPAISRMPRGPCISVLDRDLHGIPSPVTGQAAESKWYSAAESYDDPRPHACMDVISVEEVVEAVRAMWERTK